MKNALLIILITTMCFTAKVFAQTKVVPGYLGKKQILSYGFSMSPRLEQPNSEIRESGGFMNWLSPIGIHSIAYEHVISRQGSLLARLSYNNAYMEFDRNWGWGNVSQWRPQDQEDIDFLRLGVTTLGVAYKTYPVLFAPLRTYLQFGLNAVFYSTPEVEYRNASNANEMTLQHSGSNLSINLELGKTKVYRDVLVVDFALGTNIRTFQGYRRLNDVNYSSESNIEDFFNGSARHAALSSGAIYFRVSIGGIF